MDKNSINEMLKLVFFGVSNPTYDEVNINLFTTHNPIIHEPDVIKKISVTEEEFDQFLKDFFDKKIKQIKKINDSMIFKNNNEYNGLVNTLNKYGMMMLSIPSGTISKKSEQLGYRYSLKKISLELLVKILQDTDSNRINLKDQSDILNLFLTMDFTNNYGGLNDKYLQIDKDKVDSLSKDEIIYKLLQSKISLNLIVLTMSSDNLEITDVKDRFSSLLFNLNFNKIKIRVSRDYEDFLGVRNYPNLNQWPDLLNVNPPTKVYDENSLHLYSAANWSDNPFTQYISYYQVIEQKFTQIHKENLINLVQGKLTYPKFYAEDKEEVFSIIKSIISREQNNKTEEKQLEEVLKHYFLYPDDFSTLKKSLTDDQIDYYSREIPSFLDQSMKGKLLVDLNNIKQQKIYNLLGSRIYTIRTALVHNKEGRTSNYDPINNYSELIKEVPLVRAIAGNIIINSSKKFLNRRL